MDALKIVSISPALSTTGSRFKVKNYVFIFFGIEINLWDEKFAKSKIMIFQAGGHCLNIAQVNKFAVGVHGKGQNKKRGRTKRGLMRGRKRVKFGNKVLGWSENKGRGKIPERGGSKGWKRGWRKKDGKQSNNKGGDRQRNTEITIQLQNPELLTRLNRKTLLEEIDHLEAVITERLIEFKVRIMGTLGKPKRESGKGWRRQGGGQRNRQKRGGKGRNKRGGRKVLAALLPEPFNDLSWKTLLEDFGRLQDDMKESFAEFKENILGKGLLAQGFC